MKITRVIDTEIRKVKCDDGSVFAIIGRVDELLAKEIIYDNNTAGNMEKWLGVEVSGMVINEFDSLEEAKTYYRGIVK